MMEADRLLAERLQTREQEELTDEEKAKLFMEFMVKRRKHFAALRAQEKRNKPLTKTEKRNQMTIYLKHMEAQEISGKKDESSSKKAEIAQDSSEKKAGDKLESDKSKKQKTDENEEVEVDNEAELKMHMVTVKDDDIAIDAIPLATKPPMIVEYKIIREGIIGHYQLIRAEGSSKRYSSMIKRLQGKKERIKSIALKAKKEFSNDETLTSGSVDEEYAMVVRNFKKFFRRKGKFVRQPREEKKSFRQRYEKKGKSDQKCFRCGDPNHLIGDCPKPSRNKDQKAFIGGS
ncbi:zf-CCHC domain-containing protein [Tanacetum coccineum]